MDESSIEFLLVNDEDTSSNAIGFLRLSLIRPNSGRLVTKLMKNLIIRLERILIDFTLYFSWSGDMDTSQLHGRSRGHL